MNTSGQHNKCDVLVLMCIDFRFRENVQNSLKKIGLKSYDLVVYPGASSSLSSEKHSAFRPLLDAINISQNLHGIKKVVIVDHEDCGVYGGSSSFESFDDEKTAHREKIALARKAIEAETGLPVEGYLAKLDGKLETI